jgi:hypothetical protein
MKACAPSLAHKSDLGLVRVGVRGPSETRSTYDELTRRARRAVGARGRLDGILVCEQVDGGVETVVGVSQDPLFGPVVMAGFGGVLIEVLEDVTFRIPPFGRGEAQRMLEELAGRSLLRGVRGAPRPDVSALVSAIMNVQRLATDLASPDFDVQLAELDVNPLIVRPRGAIALDALVVRK